MLKKLLGLAAVAAALALASPASAQDNCEILNNATTATDGDRTVVVNLPANTEWATFTGEVDIFLRTPPENARSGGSVTLIGHCAEFATPTGEKIFVNYVTNFEAGGAMIRLPAALGAVWIRVLVRHGDHYDQWDCLLPAGETTLSLNPGGPTAFRHNPA